MDIKIIWMILIISNLNICTVKKVNIEEFDYEKYKTYWKENEFISLIVQNKNNKIDNKELENLLDSNDNLNIRIMLVDENNFIYKEVIDQFNIKEFPHYILYSKRRIKNGVFKNSSLFLKLMKFETTDNIQLIDNIKNFQNYILEDYTKIKLFLNLSTLDDKLIKDFKKLSSYLKKESKYSIHCSVVHIDEKYHKLKGKKFYDKPILFINEENQKKFIPVDIDINDHYNYLEYIEINSLPVIFEINDNNLHLLHDNHIQDILYLIDVSKNYKKLYKDLALNNINNDLFNERIIFAYVNNLENNPKTKELWMDLFGKTDDKLYLTSLKKGDLLKYSLEENLNRENFNFFIEKFRNKELKFYFKSEEINEENDDLKIVSSTFDSKVKKSKNHTLVLFCKDFEQLKCKNPLIFLRALAENNHYPDLIDFGYVNLSKNNIENFSTEVEPLFLLYHKSAKNKPKVFELDFNIDFILGWLNAHITDVKFKIDNKSFLNLVYEMADEKDKLTIIHSLRKKNHNFDVEDHHVDEFLKKNDL